MFGQRFLVDYHEEPPRLWEEALAEFPWRAVKGGLQRLLRSGAAHPPSLSLFLAMIRNEVQPPPTVIQEAPALTVCQHWSTGLLMQYAWWRIQHGKPSLTELGRNAFAEALDFGKWFQMFLDAGDPQATRETFLERFLERFVDAEDHDALRAVEQRRAAALVQTFALERSDARK